MWRFCTNQELMELCREPEKKGRLRLLRHVGIMSEERTVKNVFKIIPEGKKICWKAEGEGDGWTVLKMI